MRTRLFPLGLALVLALALAACGGDDATDDADIDAIDETMATVAGAAVDGGDVGGTASASTPVGDPCALVSEATIADFAAGATPAPTDGVFGGDLGATVGCRWDDGDFVYPLEIGVVDNPEAFAYGRDLVTELGGLEVEDVSGVGDEAYTFDEGSGVIEVVARRGDQVVQVRARTDSSVVPVAVAAEILLNL